jgi:hypothetical protein
MTKNVLMSRGFMRAMCIGGAVALVLSGCADNRGVTAPGAPTTQLPSKKGAGTTPPNVAASLVFCDLAALTPSGRYRVKQVSIKTPRELFDPGGNTVTFAARQTGDSPDPTGFVMCQIPNTPAAATFFRHHFNAGTSTQPLRAILGGEPGADPDAPRVISGEPGMVVYEMAAGGCAEYSQSGADSAPVEFDCSCVTETCLGWEDGGGTTEGPPPSDPSVPEASADPLVGSSPAPYDGPPPVGPPPIITCYGQTDIPHKSTTVPYWGTVNVKGRTVCTYELPMTVSVRLQYQKCFWFYCWWSNVGSGFDSDIFYVVQANAASTGCSNGWWRGWSYSFVWAPPGYSPPTLGINTYNYNYIYC